MSTIPAFVNAIFTLNKKGEFLLYEGQIDGGYTKVSIISKVASGYNTRYFKVKQIIAFEGEQAIVQSFDLPSQEFAYRLIEKAIMDKTFSQGDNNEKIEVVTTGQQSSIHSIPDSGTYKENEIDQSNINNSIDTYQPVIKTHSRKFTEGLSNRSGFKYPDYNDSDFNSLQSLTGTGSDEFSEQGIKIANMSSFGNGSNSSRNGNKTRNFSSIEDALDSGL